MPYRCPTSSNFFDPVHLVLALILWVTTMHSETRRRHLAKQAIATAKPFDPLANPSDGAPPPGTDDYDDRPKCACRHTCMHARTCMHAHVYRDRPQVCMQAHVYRDRWCFTIGSQGQWAMQSPHASILPDRSKSRISLLTDPLLESILVV